MFGSYQFDFFYVWSSLPNLWDGLLVTLRLTASATLVGVPLGFAVALMTMSRLRLVSVPATAFVELFRCTPALIQIVWFYYCVPLVFNLFWEAETMAVLALGLNLAAFNSEAFRAAIQAIPPAHEDAGIVLGLSRIQRIRYVVLPQALRTALPVLVTNTIGIFQQSALVALVAIEDLMYEGKLLASQTYKPIETFTIVALIYFAVSFPLSQLVSFFERQWATVKR